MGRGKSWRKEGHLIGALIVLQQKLSTSDETHTSVIPFSFLESTSSSSSFTCRYHLELEIIRLDFLSGLRKVLAERPIKAIFLGTRCGDPNARGQEVFAPSSPGWPAFMRVNPILDWSYQ